MRARETLVEYAPLSLLLMWMLETMQADPRAIHALGALLIIGRLLHMHGVHQPGGDGKGRRAGMYLTWLQIALCCAYGCAAALGFSR